MTAEEIQNFRNSHPKRIYTEFHFLNPPMKVGEFIFPDDEELKKFNKYKIIENKNPQQQTIINGDLLISLIASYETV